MQHREISESYTTVKEMPSNYGAYMDEDEKIGWYKVMKALILTGQHNYNRPIFFTPSPNQHHSSISFYDSNTTTDCTSSVPPTLPPSSGPRNGTTNAPSHPLSSRGPRNDTATFPPTLPPSSGPRNDTATNHLLSDVVILS